MARLPQRSFLLIPLIILLIGTTLFFTSTRVYSGLQGGLATAFNPVQEFFGSVENGLQNIQTYFTDKQKLTDERDQLAERARQLEYEVTNLRELMNDNVILTQELAFAREFNLRLVTGKIIGHSPDNPNVLIINKGEGQGIRVGMPLIAGPGTFIGTIIQTQANTSLALLLQHNQSRVAAVVQNEDNPEGVVTGSFGLSLTMELIPQEKKLEAGDWVITSGQETYIPRGLVIGQVETISSNPGELFKKASISQTVNAQLPQIVSVVITI